MSEPVAPKLFLSYSWTTPEHETWVTELAQELNDNGIHVVYDKWDLKEGQEANAFMEQMVTDPTVTKVLMICDKKYADRADRRVGGAGTEAQIISSKIYQPNDSKFVAAVRERDEHGKPCLPAYYSSRIYIDLSEESRYAAEFERLLRWIYDKPLNPRPPLGTKPGFLSESREGIRLNTATEHRRAIDALKNDKPTVGAAVADYLNTLSNGLEKFRISFNRDQSVPFDELMIQNIEDFLPYRNEAIELFITLARYRADENTQRTLHRFFEKLLSYNYVPEGTNSYNTHDFDNFKFLSHEMMLYAIAVFISEERYDFINDFLSTPYYVPSRADYGKDPTVSYDAFWQHPETLERRNNRLKLNRRSLHADILKTRNSGSGFHFSSIMQADFVLYMRRIFSSSEGYQIWYPVTLIYSGEYPSAFEIFARSKSQKYWEKVKPLLSLSDMSPLNDLVIKITKGEINVPSWGWHRLGVSELLGSTKLATIP